jgi:adenosylcobyric acid synthase
MVLQHGGNLRELALRAGLDREQMLDFSASINPLGPPAQLRAVLARNIERLVHYPDPNCTELVALLAQRYRVAPQHIVVGNGSTEIFFALCRAIPFARAIIPVPSYIDYAVAVQSAGRPVEFLKLEESAEFAVDWPTLEGQLHGNELVLLGQPNNPTARAFDLEMFRAVAARHLATTFVVDEAFADFMAGYRSLAEQVAIGSPVPANVIVVRSLTKFYAIPGLRLGFAVASADTAARIKSQILPWSVGTLAQEAAVAVLADDDYARNSIALVQQQREWLAQELASVPGLHVYPSETNYLLVRLSGHAESGSVASAGPRTAAHCLPSAQQLAEQLLRQGIAIRTFTADQHLDERFFRVAVRTQPENARLIEALHAMVETLGAPVPCLHLPSSKRAAALMIQGTSSNAGKSVLTAAICRILLQDGIRVAPFKSQNMSLNSFIARDGGEMGRAQVVQAQACRLEPDVRMNPILLKPNSDTGCQVIVRGKPVGNMRVAEYVRYKDVAFAAAKACYDSLAAEFDAVILEGAGSPGEVNLKSHDIVNMRMAEYADAPVLVVGDIDRGGVFASFVGTMEVLDLWERKRVAGWIVNRFRGDASLLGPALEYTLRHTGRPVLGVVPFMPALNLPQEDSVEFKSGALDQAAGDTAAVEIAVIDLPHISNFTDIDPFRGEGDVRLRIIRSAEELGHPDAVIIPGSKNTLADLQYLRRSGLAERISMLAQEGTAEIVGICGGLQILGREICDPLGIESSAARACGLGLLGISTTLAAEKTLARTAARHELSGLEVVGYEIHHGRTDGDGHADGHGSAGGNGRSRPNGFIPLFSRSDGQVVGFAGDDPRIWGTYLHGVFDADPFRRWFIDRLRQRRGLPPLGEVVGRYDIEPALDRLAETVRAALPMDDIYRLLKL